MNLEIIGIYLLQIVLVVHVFKTGRNRIWIFLLIFVPLIGGAAYLLVEVLPELAGGMTGRKTMRKIKTSFDAGGEVRRQAAAFEHSPNADNARRYARALLEDGQAKEADQVLQQSMGGLFRTEPNLMLLRAQAVFNMQEYGAAVRLLRELRESNPEFKSADGHLLLARALEAANEQAGALQEYRSVAGYFPGAEARYRWGLALKNAGQVDEARAVFKLLVSDAKHAPAHYRKAERKWLKQANGELQGLGG